MKELLQKLHDAAMQAILETEDVDSLESLRVKYLGKKGELTSILRQAVQGRDLEPVLPSRTLRHRLDRRPLRRHPGPDPSPGHAELLG